MADKHAREPGTGSPKTQAQMLPGSIEAILLDLDGTLIETDNRWAAIAAAGLAPLKRLCPWLDTEALARRLVMSVEMPANYVISLVERLGLGSDFLGLTDRLRRSKGLATRGGSELVKGSETLLSALSLGYKMALVTTRARREALAFVRRARFERFFPVIVTRQDVFRMKPHPQPVRVAASLLGIAPERCAMVGDTIMDVRSARRAGAYAVAVLSGFGHRQELERAGAHLILERAEQLLAHLPRW